MITKTKWFIYLFILVHLEGSVAPNPFLKPGSNRKPPENVKPVFKPKPILRPNISKELEFKGYFILKEQVYFSLFNKKVNHGEWISINEKTYEDFTAEKFDLETETLTILYEGQSFELRLLESKSSIALPSRNPVIANPKSISSKPALPKVMPPKPKSNPVIPSFLVNKTVNSPFPGSRSTPSSSSLSGGGIRSRIPGMPYPGFIPRRTTPGNPTSITAKPSPNRVNNSFSSESNANPSSSTGISDPNINTPTNPWISKGNTNNSEIDLNSLPPPPPPPNILPPSPPPNLVPARED